MCAVQILIMIYPLSNQMIFIFRKKGIRKNRKCVASGCGIVECKLSFKRWVEKPDYKKMVDDAIPIGELNKSLIKNTKDKIKNLKKYLKKLEAEEGKK